MHRTDGIVAIIFYEQGGKIANLLKADTKLMLHVVGHTDNIGSCEADLNLSKRRAGAVITALTMGYGSSAGRLAANGMANPAPVAIKSEEEGRAENRRGDLVPR